MSSSNPRRTPMTRRDPNTPHGLSLKTTTTLQKGATFHSPTSPAAGPSLRRSQTTLDDVVGAHQRRVALTLSSIDQSFSSSSSTSTKSSLSSSTNPLRDNSLPVPSVFLDNSLRGVMAKDDAKEGTMVLRSRTTRPPSDSGIGSSIVTSAHKRAAAPGAKNSGKLPTKASAITRSAASTTAEKLPGLSTKAQARIREHILRPLLAKPSLKDFRPVVEDCPRRIKQKEILCLRDLEKTILFLAPVSSLLADDGVWGVTYRMLRLKERAKTANLYLDFCLTSLALIHNIADSLSEREQTRPSDRPYTNGYFIDLTEQIKQYATQLSTKDKDASSSMDIKDEIKLYGGIAVNGRPAELVRITKDGKAISLANGLVIEDYEEDVKDVPRFKRSLSQTLEDEEEIRRSMARRKKNPTPEELAPKVCKHPGCGKEFARPCDLTKHEKTHSRPWKCPEVTCKYHDQGWPTEKEMDRHYNDKHAKNPHFYTCKFHPCPYKSKRESNCKQHMEKAHGWTYDRTKNNGKKGSSKPSSSTHPTPITPNLPTPVSEPAYATPPHHDYVSPGAPSAPQDLLFPPLQTHSDFMMEIGGPQPDMLDDLSLELELDSLDMDMSPVIDNGTPSTDTSIDSFNHIQPDLTDLNMPDDLYSNHVQLPPTPSHEVFMKGVDQLPMYPTGHIQFPVQQPFPQQPIHQLQPIQMPHPEPHISPIGQGNTMFFTPASMKDSMDEGFDEPFGEGKDDFLLFPIDHPPKPIVKLEMPLFPEMPSTLAGLSQATAHDFGLDIPVPMDVQMEWVPEYLNM